MIKNIVIVIVIVIVFFSLYFGSFLPLAKSQRFISALRFISSVKTLDEFKANFDRPLKFYSPVGAEEIAKFLSNNILQIISQKEQSEAVSRELVSYIEPYMFKNNIRHLTALGHMYMILWERYGRKEEYFQKAENYYREAYQIGPKLPSVLYGMLNLYKAKGDVQKSKEIGEIIGVLNIKNF